MLSINLTIHNKAQLLEIVLGGIFRNTTLPFEFICVLDGCTDESEDVLMRFLGKQDNKNMVGYNILYAENIFETKSNNIAAKASKGEFVCIIQDDQVITEHGWDQRIIEPFRAFNDVFAVTANCAHNWEHNVDSIGIKDGWSDLLNHIDHANKEGIPRNVFAIRDSVNRGPLVIDRANLKYMDYFDDIYAPLEMDEHDLMYRMAKKIGKCCGYYNIGWYSDPKWGGTRDAEGKMKQWALDAQIKNVEIFYDRHKDIINAHKQENREL